MSDSTALAQVAPQGAAIVNAPMAADEGLQAMVTLAGMMAESGMFPNAKDRNKALTLMMLGREMGFTPVQSLNGLNVINGKPSLGANLMAAKVKSSGKYDYRVVEHSDAACEIHFFERGQTAGTSRFTLRDAEAAGYTKNPQYKAAPRNMLFARAMSNGVKWYCPDVFGGVPVYHEGEMEIAQALRADSPVASAGSYLELTRAITPAESDEATAYGQSIGVTRPKLAQIRAATTVDWRFVLLEAKRLGKTTFDDAIALVLPIAEDEPLDAEFTEAGGPKAPSAPSAASGGSPSSPSTPGTSAASAGTSGSAKSAFGWTPERWPAAFEFRDPRTEAQRGTSHQEWKERGAGGEDVYGATRAAVLSALGVEHDGSKATAALWIDFLLNAPGSAMTEAIEAAYAQQGQGSLTV